MGTGSTKLTTASPDSNDSNKIHDQFISKLIGENKIVVFSRTNCGYCNMAKSKLDELKLTYNAIELDMNKNCPNDNCQQLIDRLILQTRMRTVPQIFVDGKLIGGYDNLEHLLANDKSFLEKLKQFKK